MLKRVCGFEINFFFFETKKLVSLVQSIKGKGESEFKNIPPAPQLSIIYDQAPTSFCLASSASTLSGTLLSQQL